MAELRAMFDLVASIFERLYSVENGDRLGPGGAQK